MKSYLSLAILAGLFVWTGAALADDPITIKIRRSAEGDVGLIDASETANLKFKIVDDKGKVLLDNATKTTETATYKETILKREGSVSTKLERAYNKAEMKEGDKTTDLELSGKTVIIEKKGDKYTFTFKGGEEVKGPAAAVLMKEFASKKDDKKDDDLLEKLILPKGPVKTNDTWKIDAKEFAKDMNKDGGTEFDLDKATGEGKLLKAYKKDGKQYGEIQVKIELPIKAMQLGKDKVMMNPGAKMVLELTADGCVDGTTDAGTVGMKFQMNGSWSSKEGEGSLSMDSDKRATKKDVPK